MTPLKNVPLLLNLAYAIYNRGLDADLRPSKGETGEITTYCNIAVSYVTTGFGYMDLNKMTANQMVEFMASPKNGWITVSEEVAQAHANSGVIVIAGKQNPSGHGHVCLIIPGILEMSWTFNKAVPKCVNIGKDVFIGKRISYAFEAKDAPDYFALAGMI